MGGTINPANLSVKPGPLHIGQAQTVTNGTRNAQAGVGHDSGPSFTRTVLIACVSEFPSCSDKLDLSEGHVSLPGGRFR
jgi:hypothetical protein